jgi:hypothetical protein
MLPAGGIRRRDNLAAEAGIQDDRQAGHPRIPQSECLSSAEVMRGLSWMAW